MVMIGARRPSQIPLTADPVNISPAIGAAPVPPLATMPALPPIQSHAFFGQNGAGRAIAGAIGDALLQMGHMQPIYAPAKAEQSAYERGDTLYSRQRSDKLTDENNAFTQQMALEAWKEQHRNDPLTDYMTKGGIVPTSPEGRALYAERARSYANPPRYVTVNGQVFQVGGGDAAPQTVSQLPPDAVPIDGGPTQPASGGFPY